ncbi:hypothetical protein L1987_20840 [Smallanthus sonchifolius]|uniref:Uncharacterized protein n=1 Tax=Smallanthus sonchifolius TaxID=185202 RepID=A0ACB9ITX0_9ASTR|nr:hypothetical protein L1987_20840 [Smallanthus sonchifolius]
MYVCIGLTIIGGLYSCLTVVQLVEDGVTTVSHGITGIPMEGTIPRKGKVPKEYSEEGSVHAEPEVSVHWTEQIHDEERHFTFKPEVKAALAREFTEMMRASLPNLLAEALKKANEAGGSNTTIGAPNNEAVNAPLTHGRDYKSFKGCHQVLTGKKDTVATFDLVIRICC